jgi:hypothetical protein
VVFEPIVRPFQDRPVSPASVILDQVTIIAPEGQSFGSEGGATFSFSYNFSGTATAAADEWKETKRKSETVRITNPDDSSQFVETKRAKQIQFNDTQTGKNKRVYNFNYPDNSAG